MSNHPSLNPVRDGVSPSVVYFGMRCAFSVPPLKALIDAGMDLRAIVLPGAPGSAPVQAAMAGQPRVVRLRETGAQLSIDDLAEIGNVPIVSVRGMRNEEVAVAIESFSPDVIAVACFPWLFPECIRSIPRFGCLNLHPSLLPRWRGPEPVLWALKSGDPVTGVTVHLMDGGFDTGPVVGQVRYAIPGGVDGRALERELATLGGTLLAEATSSVVTGTFVATAQDESSASFAPIPTDDDLTFNTAQSAERLFNLIRGIAPLWGPLRLRISATGAEITVTSALDFDASATLGDPFVRRKNRVLLQCNPGVVTLLDAGNERLHALTGIDAI
jgi:methionyl-tRNA formyltransferase